MKQDVTEYWIDSFVDFRGDEHKIVACALSQSPQKGEDGSQLVIGWADEPTSYIDTEDFDYAHIYRMVTIGISVCHPTDTFNEETGKARAYQKALNDPKCPTIYTKNKGVASRALIEAFLKQEVNFLKENPERIIAGYNQAKARFDKKQAIKDKIANLSDKERLVMKLASEVDVIQCAKLAEEAKKAGIEYEQN